MAQLYADEDFSYPVVQELRRLGDEVVTAREAGQAGGTATDEDILAFAISQQRCVITFNRRHFIRLHREHPTHSGIIVCTRDSNVLALASRIHRAIANRTTLANELIRINRPHQP